MLLFSSSFAAGDYLRYTRTPGKVGRFRVDKLPEMARSWLSLGIKLAALDRCPRCPYLLWIALAGMAKWTQEDFAKVWAQHRAMRVVMAEIQIRAAMNHSSAGSHGAARGELECVRDHLDCGVP